MCVRALMGAHVGGVGRASMAYVREISGIEVHMPSADMHPMAPAPSRYNGRRSVRRALKSVHLFSDVWHPDFGRRALLRVGLAVLEEDRCLGWHRCSCELAEEDSRSTKTSTSTDAQGPI